MAAAAKPKARTHSTQAVLHHPQRVLQGLELVAEHNQVRKTAVHTTAAHKAASHEAAARTNATRKAATPAAKPADSTPAPAPAPAPTPAPAPAPAPASAPARQPSSSVRFEWPAQGTITTPFRPSGPGRHDGIDIGELRSLTVVAAHSGEVIHVGYTAGFEGYGNIVDVEFAPGYETIYAHLSAMSVQVGQQVSAGEVIGTAGCTGYCDGTHVHFEVRENGTPVDPLDFLP